MTEGTESHSTGHSSGITTTTVAAVKDSTGNTRELYVLESWLIIPLFPVGILLGWGEGQMILICCVNLFIYFRLYKVPDGKL